MNKKTSAGILLYRKEENQLQVFLVHTGGPYGYNKDNGYWSIPKGEFGQNDNVFYTALREFKEETGISLSNICYKFLGKHDQNPQKTVYIWASEYNYDINEIKSNTFTMEWPKGSGKIKEFPEIDKGQWFNIEEAKEKITKGQIYFLERLENG